MKPWAGEIRRLGGELVFVGNGTAEQAAAFRDEHGLELPLYTDPTGRTHRAAGFRRGAPSSLGPRALLNAVRTLAQGFRQEFVAGDPFQQGGVLVIAPGDETVYVQRSRAAGDHAEPQEVVGALKDWTRREAATGGAEAPRP